MPKPIIAKLVRPGVFKHWSYQAINVLDLQQEAFYRARFDPVVQAAYPKLMISRNNWVCLQFQSEDYEVVRAAALALASVLAVHLVEGDFSSEDLMPYSPCHVPAWLTPLLGEREKCIMHHPAAHFFYEDRDGNRLPDFQQLVESPAGDMVIDSKRRTILC